MASCMCSFLPHCPTHGDTGRVKARSLAAWAAAVVPDAPAPRKGKGHGLPVDPEADLLYYVTWARRRDGRRTRSATPLPLADLEAWTAPSEEVVEAQLAPLATIRAQGVRP